MRHTLIMLILHSLLPLPAKVQTAAFTPVADAYIRSTQSAAQLNNRSNHLFLVGNTARSNDVLRGLIAFELNRQELLDAEIHQVRLILTVEGRDQSGGGSSDLPGTIQIHALKSSFTEDSVDWMQRESGEPWSREGGVFGKPLASIDANPAELSTGMTLTLTGEELTRYVQNASGGPLRLLVKLKDEAGPRRIFRILSSNRSAAAGPQLLIDYTPSDAVRETSLLLGPPLTDHPEVPSESVIPLPGHPEAVTSPRYALDVAGHSVEVKAERYDFDVAMFTLGDRPALVDIRVAENFSEFSLKPTRHALQVKRIGNTLRFELDQPLKLVLQIPGQTPLAIIATPNEANPPSPDDPDVIYFGPGTTTAGVIRPQSHQTIYLAPGALVKGRIEARGVEHVKILGRGFLETAGYSVRADKTEGILFDQARHIRVEGISLRSFHTWWQMLFLNATHIEVAHMNLFGVGVNTDGVDIDAVKYFVVRDTFIRAEDDGLGWHGIDARENGEMITENALAENIVIWNTFAGNGIRIGASTEAQLWRDITLRNIDILEHANWGLYSDHSDWAWIRNLRFENITIKRNRTPISFYIAQTRYSSVNDTRFLDERGHYDRLVFENVVMNGGEIRLAGHGPRNRMNHVRFNQCFNAGVPITSTDHLVLNDYVTNIAFNEVLPPLPGQKHGIHEMSELESSTHQTPQYIADAPEAFFGRIRVFAANGPGDSIRHDLASPGNGPHILKFRILQTPESGQARLSVNGRDHGPLIDFYAQDQTFKIIDLGHLHLSEKSGLDLRFTVTGKHVSSLGFHLHLDAVQLIQVPAE